jgi:hypothetical protein
VASHFQLTTLQQELITQVQHNCDISDANHAGNYTLCIYLLKMREYYRWIHALDFSDNFDSESMSSWLRDKEEIWDQVIDEPYKTIINDSVEFDIFDNRGINAHLHDQQLFYHAGIGRSTIQHFFVAERVHSYTSQNTQITVTGKEYARDLTAPPAMSTQTEIVVRQESLKRMCWERYQEWHWSKLDNPMGTALAYYPFDDSIPDALQLMVEAEQNTLIQHEIGEMKITSEFGEQWSAMMLGLLGSKAELMARAVRDNLADSLSTLPFLIQQQNPACLHFYFANLTYMRKELFPSAISAFQKWSQTGDLTPLTSLSQPATQHWRKTVISILEISQQKKQDSASKIVALVDQSKY